MNRDEVVKALPVVALVLCLFAAALAFRPVLPIDETRYLTVAWELFLHHDYSKPTLNFEPYHHKPPLLFFLIDGAWDIFGVSRWAALMPFFAFSLGFIYLTRALALRLFPERVGAAERISYLALGSLPFLIYGTIIMFDIMLSVFVLGFYLFMLRYFERPVLRSLLLAGVCLGLGGLTKGPVVMIYTLLPMMLLAAWERKEGLVRAPRTWLKALLIPLLVGLGIVGIWLVDLFFETGLDFFKNLIVRQTIDRVNGQMESSHARPVYFYLPLLPVLFLPWALFPAFWRNVKAVVAGVKTDTGMKILALWLVGGFVAFSLISGKQPHYLVPLLPPVLVVLALCLEKVNVRAVQLTAAALVALVCAGQAVAEKDFLSKYDLAPMAKIVAEHPDADWAFVRKYQGELGYLGRITHHIDSLEFDQIDLWFKQHPDGYMIIRHHATIDVPKYHLVYSMPYRSRVLGIYTKDDKVERPQNIPVLEKK